MPGHRHVILSEVRAPRNNRPSSWDPTTSVCPSGPTHSQPSDQRYRGYQTNGGWGRTEPRGRNRRAAVGGRGQDRRDPDHRGRDRYHPGGAREHSYWCSSRQISLKGQIIVIHFTKYNLWFEFLQMGFRCVMKVFVTKEWFLIDFTHDKWGFK